MPRLVKSKYARNNAGGAYNYRDNINTWNNAGNNGDNAQHNTQHAYKLTAQCTDRIASFLPFLMRTRKSHYRLKPLPSTMNIATVTRMPNTLSTTPIMDSLAETPSLVALTMP